MMIVRVCVHFLKPKNLRDIPALAWSKTNLPLIHYDARFDGRRLGETGQRLILTFFHSLELYLYLNFF